MEGNGDKSGKRDKRKVCSSKCESDEVKAHGLQWETMGRFKSMRLREREKDVGNGTFS